MGTQRARKREHFFLCLACSITILIGVNGCIPFVKNLEGDRRLTAAKSLMGEGEYEASLRENREILRQYAQTHGDRALFQLGLIYLHPQNPNVDYQEALTYFQGLIEEFPGSDLRSEAEIWISVLQKFSDNEKVIHALIKEKDFKEKELTQRENKINKLRGELDRLQGQKNEVQRERERMAHRIEDLEKQIKRLKEIDLRIEEKKRGQ